MANVTGFSEFVKGILNECQLEMLHTVLTTRLNQTQSVYQKSESVSKLHIGHHGTEYRESKNVEIKPRRIIKVKKQQKNIP